MVREDVQVYVMYASNAAGTASKSQMQSQLHALSAHKVQYAILEPECLAEVQERAHCWLLRMLSHTILPTPHLKGPIVP